MSQTNELMELTDHEAETAAGGACRLAGVLFLDPDGDGNVDGVVLIYACS